MRAFEMMSFTRLSGHLDGILWSPVEIAVNTLKFGGNSTILVIPVKDISSSSRVGGNSAQFSTPWISL